MTPEQREFLHQTSVRLPTVNRLLVLCAALLAGGFGAHKFLLGARREGWMYLALCWTGVTVLAAITDFCGLFTQPVICTAGTGFAQRRLVGCHPAERDVVQHATARLLWICAAVMVLLVLIAAWWQPQVLTRGV